MHIGINNIEYAVIQAARRKTIPRYILVGVDIYLTKDNAAKLSVKIDESRALRSPNTSYYFVTRQIRVIDLENPDQDFVYNNIENCEAIA